MANLDAIIKDLVIANRILDDIGLRNSCGRRDAAKNDLSACAGAVVQTDHAPASSAGLQGSDHHAAGIFEARPEINSVVHAHAEDTLPFGIAAATKLKPVIHSGSFIGPNVPVWDIADKFGATNVLVTNMAQGRDLAKCLGKDSVALMRGHGFASAARSLIEVVRLSVYLPRNARALMRAKILGGKIKYLSKGEMDARNKGYSPYSTETWRAWEYWANKAGVGNLLTRPDGGSVFVHKHDHDHKH